MGLFDEIEKDLAGLIGTAPLEHIKKELESLATQVGHIAQQMEQAKGNCHWSGKAADAFHEHADKRITELHHLMQELDLAAEAVGAVTIVGGLLP